MTPEAAVRARDQILGLSDASKWDKDTVPVGTLEEEEGGLATAGSRKWEGRAGRAATLLTAQGKGWRLLARLRCSSEPQSLFGGAPDTAKDLWRSCSSGATFSQSLSSLSLSSSMSSRSLKRKSFSSLQSL